MPIDKTTAAQERTPERTNLNHLRSSFEKGTFIGLGLTWFTCNWFLEESISPLVEPSSLILHYNLNLCLLYLLQLRTCRTLSARQYNMEPLSCRTLKNCEEMKKLDILARGSSSIVGAASMINLCTKDDWVGFN